MGRLEDKTAFISGAAGSIGAATARRFVAEGARVVLSDVDADRLHALADELGAEAAVADVTDSAAEAVALAGELDTSRSPTPASSATWRRSRTTTRRSSSACWPSTCPARSTSPSTRCERCARAAA